MSQKKTNQLGIDLIKYYESLRLTAYRDQVGVLTIGWGHTGQDVVEGQTISSIQAELLLKNDLTLTETGVSTYVRAPLTDNQFSALVSLAYNIGLGAFGKSTLLKELNTHDYAKAADQFLVWEKAGGKESKGLLARRRAERDLFLKT